MARTKKDFNKEAMYKKIMPTIYQSEEISSNVNNERVKKTEITKKIDDNIIEEPISSKVKSIIENINNPKTLETVIINDNGSISDSLKDLIMNDEEDKKKFLNKVLESVMVRKDGLFSSVITVTFKTGHMINACYKKTGRGSLQYSFCLNCN